MGQLKEHWEEYHRHTRSICLWLRPRAVARLTFTSFTLASAESILIVSLMGFWLRPLAAARLTFTSFTLACAQSILIVLHTINMLFAEQTFRPDQQERQCERVREPDLQSGEIDADAHRLGQRRVQELRDVNLRQLFPTRR